MKNKFNIGDKVMIRMDLEVGKIYGGLPLLPRMAEHCGLISEIVGIDFRDAYSCCYVLKDVCSSIGMLWIWSEEMLEGPMKYLCDVKIPKSGAPNIKIEKVSGGPKFKKGDSVKVIKQFTDVKAGCYQVLDVLYINGKSWYTLKGAPMIWVPEEYLEINDPKSYTKPQEFDDNDYVYVLDKFGMVSYKSVYSIVHEDKFTEHLFRHATMDNRCFSNVKAITAYQHWTQPIADICRFKQEKDAEFVSTEDNPGYTVDFLPTAGGFGAHVLRSPCMWVPTFSTFNLALECANWINGKYNL